jgi:thiamine transporter
MKKTQRLAVSGVLIALAVVLSMVKIFEWPFGGSITLFSMTPVMLAGWLYGVPWGLLCGLVDGILQGALGAATTQAFAGLAFWQTVGMACLDYLLAFSVLGCAGLLRKALHDKPRLGFAIGSVIAGLLRYAVHTVSGALLWGSYAEWFFTQEGFYAWGADVLAKYSGTQLVIVYSLIYNGFYMLPEILLSVVAAVALMSVKPLREAALRS